MAETRKVLGQAALSATTPTDVYTVPSATQAVVSSLVVCNRGGAATTFRVSVAVAGAGADNKQYIFYDTALPANDTYIATIGVALAATDVVRFYTAGASVTATVFGVEIT